MPSLVHLYAKRHLHHGIPWQISMFPINFLCVWGFFRCRSVLFWVALHVKQFFISFYYGRYLWSAPHSERKIKTNIHTWSVSGSSRRWQRMGWSGNGFVYTFQQICVIAMFSYLEHRTNAVHNLLLIPTTKTGQWITTKIVVVRRGKGERRYNSIDFDHNTNSIPFVFPLNGHIHGSFPWMARRNWKLCWQFQLRY